MTLLADYSSPDPTPSGAVRVASTPAEFDATLKASVPGNTVLVDGQIKWIGTLPKGVIIRPAHAPGAGLDAIIGSLTTAPECALLDLEVFQSPDQAAGTINGVICQSQGCVMRRLHIHNVYGNGVSIFGSRYGELSECLIHDVGQQALYSHNDLQALNADGSPKTIDVLRNVFWAAGDGHVQFYSAGKNFVRNYRVVQNILIGLTSTVGGTLKPSSNFLFQSNQVLKGALAKFGYPVGNQDLRVIDNVFSSAQVEYQDWDAIEHRGNVYHSTRVISDYPLPLGSPFTDVLPDMTTIPLMGSYNLAWVVVPYADTIPNPNSDRPFDPNVLPLVPGVDYKLIDVQLGTQKDDFTFTPGMKPRKLKITSAPQVLALRTA